jgi:phosphoribosylformylglycinamidine cyclo-ligase
MPGFYQDGEYDIAGFIVGVVDREKIIDGKTITPGDVLLALPSAGLHTNGYSLARKLFFDVAGYQPDTVLPELEMTAGEALLLPHLSYLKPLDELLDEEVIKGLAHITGGGLTDNIPRILPEGTAVQIKRDSWPTPPLFELLRRLGNVSGGEMYRTFNMGVGMVIVCSETEAGSIETHLRDRGEQCYSIGRVISGKREVRI